MMNLICMDLEGVLIPEIWINFAEKTGISELRLTTRDISDYDVLMNKRINILKENNLTLGDIQDVIATMDPLEGAFDFLEELRSLTQVIILSDTFEEFAQPLMKKLRWPTLFCNSLEVNSQGTICSHIMRQQDGKKKAIQAFHSTNCRILAAGDSYNDVSMLQTADKGILFKAPDSIKAEFPELTSAEEYSELLSLAKDFISDSH